MKHPGVLGIPYGIIPYWRGHRWRRNRNEYCPHCPFFSGDYSSNYSHLFDTSCICDVYHSLEECKNKRMNLGCE
jgi:hypothetical protein